MGNIVNNAIEAAIAKEAKKLVDIKGLAEKVAVQITKDIEKTIKKGELFDSDNFIECLTDHLDYYNLARMVSKDINKKLMVAARK